MNYFDYSQSWRGRFAALAAALVLVSAVMSSARGRNWLSFSATQTPPGLGKSAAAATPPKPSMALADSGANGVLFDYQFPGALVSEDDFDGVMYQLLHVDKFNKLNEPGKPALPARWFTVAVPDGMSPRIDMLDVQTATFSGYTIRPALKPAPDYVGAPEPSFEIDQATYGADVNYPETPVRIVGIRTYRGMALAKIQVCPVLHNPAREELTAYSRIRFKVAFERKKDASAADQSFGPHHARLLANIAANPSVLEAATTPNALESIAAQLRGGMLILTTPAYEPAAETLAVWKRRMGFEATLIARSDWTETSVKDTIHARYAAAAPPLEFCAIIGDHPDVPSQWSTLGSYDHVTDLYYACMDGAGDFTPDIGIGRISVSSATEAMAVIHKIVNYERNPVADPAFYATGLAAAYFQHAGSGYAERRFAQTSWEIRQYLINHQGYAVDREFYTGSTVSPTNWNNGYYSSGEAIPSYLQRPTYAWDGNAAGISAGINAGRFLVTHRDHGDVTVWGDPYYTTSDISALANGDKLPVVLSINCLTGRFDYSAPCFSEAFLRHPAGGAVGVVCATHISYSGQNDGLAAGIIDGIWPDPGLVPLFPHNTNPTVAPHDPLYHMGLALNQGKMRMSETWNGASAPFNYEQYTYELFHFLGDPSMQIWTAEPATITASAASSMMVGQTNYTISGASCAEGVATMLFDGEIIGRCQLTNGGGVMTLDPAPQTTGTALLTITSHNYRPYEEAVTVIPPGDALILSAPSAETVFDIGETITATWQTYGDIADVTVAFSDDNGATFSVVAAATQNRDEHSFPAPAVSSDSCLIRVSDVDGDPYGESPLFSIQDLSVIAGVVAGGAQAQVHYSGPSSGSISTDAGGAYALDRLTPGVYTLYAVKGAYQSTSATATVPPDTTIDFSIDYPLISVAPAAIRAEIAAGDSATVHLVIANTGGAVLEYQVDGASAVDAVAHQEPHHYDETHFVDFAKGEADARKGMPVADSSGGPDQFGYAWVDSDDPSGPAFVWHDIAATGIQLSSSSCDDCAASAALSFAFPFYGVDYTSLYVSSNGYITFGTASSQFSNYPIPGTNMPSNLIAGFFDDLHPGSGGTVYFQDFGDHAIVQFQQVNYFSGAGTVTYQMALHANGDILLNYSSMTGSVTSATIGIQNGARDDGLAIAYNTAYVRDSLAVRIARRPEWLRISKNAGTVAPSGRDTVTALLSARDMAGGTYDDHLTITHNAPENPVEVPCTLIVDGIRRLALSSGAVDFGSIWRGADSTITLVLENAGTEQTTVTRIESDNPAFRYDGPAVPFTVPFFDQVEIALTYAPSSIGAESATLSIESNAEDNPLLTATLAGEGAEPPSAQLSPLSLHFALTPGDMPADQTSVLSNTGGDDLTWRIASVRQLSSPLDSQDDRGSPAPGPLLDKVYDPAQYENPFVPGRVIVGFVRGADSFADDRLLAEIDAESVRELGRARNPHTGERALKRRTITLITLASKDRAGVLDAIERLRRDDAVAYAEPDYLIELLAAPDDPYFSNLYGLHNTGQTGGTADADIDGPEAWDTHTGDTSVLIGVLDTGIDYLHPDLADNIWTNPGEIAGNGIDDDGNGYIDDIHGWDFSNDDNDPTDDHGHGTHCAGTIGAVGNNGVGVAGVMWDAEIMAIKVFNSGGGLNASSDALDGIVYANAMGVQLASNSWGVPYSAAMQDAIADGGLYVFAAGNDYGNNNDTSPVYPASYPLDNIIAVAATDHNDALASFSNYGPASVDLGAPGVDVYSCAPGGSYQYMSGTSMATPHVAGAAGLVWSRNPSMTMAEIKQALLDNVDPVSSLTGMVLSDGRLNVAAALEDAGPAWLSAASAGTDTIAPGASRDITVTADPAGLVAGRWAGEVTIETDDPANPTMTIAAVADIASCKSLVAGAGALDFGAVWTGGDSLATVTMTNSCNDTVTISALDFSNPAFSSLASAPLPVLPFESIELTVRYAPAVAGTDAGTLTIASDADDNPSIGVALSGQGVHPPEIAIHPASLADTLDGGDSATHRVTVVNSGGDDLIIAVRKQPSAKLERASRSFVLSAREGVAPVDQDGSANVVAVDTVATEPLAIEAADLTGVTIAYDISHGQADSSYSSMLIGDCEQRGAYVYRNSAAITAQMLDTVDILWLDDVPSSGFSAAESLAVDAWLKNGGAILFAADQPNQMAGFPEPYGIAYVSGSSSGTSADIIEHPVTDSVDSVYIGSPVAGLAVSGQAIAAVNDIGGVPHICAAKPDAGRILVIGDETLYNSAMSYADNRRLGNNAIDWLAGLSQSPWLTVDIDLDTIAPSGSLDIGVVMHANDLLAGTYASGIDIVHNAPATVSPAMVPCTLTVEGYRRLALATPAVDFGAVRIDSTAIETLTVINDGNEETTISSILVSHAEFASDIAAPLIVPAMGSAGIVVRYAPADTGSDVTVLQINSDAGDNPLLTIELAGTGVRGPVIALTPDSVMRYAPLETTVTTTMTVANTGDEDLWYQIAGEGDGVVVINEFCNNPDFIELWNQGAERDLSGWRIEWVDNTSTSGSFTFPAGFMLPAGKRVVLRENSGTANDSTFYWGANMGWVENSVVSAALLDNNGAGVDFVRTVNSTTAPPPGTSWSGAVGFSSFSAWRNRNEDGDTQADWSVSSAHSEFELNPGQSETGMWPSWLTVSPASGTVAGGQAREATLELSAVGCAAGVYATELHVMHSDNNQSSPLRVPVVMEVVESAPGVSRIVRIGPAAAIGAAGSAYRLEQIVIGAPAGAILRGAAHTLIVR
jgi:hypothetical protein